MILTLTILAGCALLGSAALFFRAMLNALLVGRWLALVLAAGGLLVVLMALVELVVVVARGVR